MPGLHKAAANLAIAIGCVALFASAAQAADDRVAKALVAREHGDNTLAITLLRSAANDAPTDADTLRVLGTTLAFAHRYPEAIVVLDRALALSPRDGDIVLALARALLWSGDLRGAQRIATGMSTTDPGNSELPELKSAINSAERDAPKVALDVAQTVSHVSIGNSGLHWYETAATLSVPVGARTMAVAGIDVEDRGTATDSRLSLRGDQRFAWGTVYTAATATPSATFRERWSVTSGALVPVTPILQGSIEVRRAHYDLVDVTVIDAGATIHSRAERWALTAHSINLWGEGGAHHFGWSLRGDFLPSKAIRLFGGGATYSDTEASITRRVDSGFLGAAFPVSGRLSAQIVADHEVRRASYRRNGITVGLHWRFGQ